MYHQYKISDAEQSVLEMLWKCGGEIKQTELLQQFEESGKEWKRQTLNTLITRLAEKGLVTRENRVVKAVFSEKEFYNRKMEEMIDRTYYGKLSSFISAFTEYRGISEEEMQEILSLLEQKKQAET
ncbi:MAG: BlaI/MecI/CopY family transcriptional regulator [Lachnoclostridium sp.]|nr:BlaI/MecI/CopY family transcriptional regulator [Lachnospira sp.]MCM1248163.1 BlaI/MecI/CopY family transcriptional regulator [Lachnoclostridium sp.]